MQGLARNLSLCAGKVSGDVAPELFPLVWHEGEPIDFYRAVSLYMQKDSHQDGALAAQARPVRHNHLLAMEAQWQQAAWREAQPQEAQPAEESQWRQAVPQPGVPLPAEQRVDLPLGARPEQREVCEWHPHPKVAPFLTVAAVGSGAASRLPSGARSRGRAT